MIAFGLKFKDVKRQFFDRGRVIRATDAATRKVLSRMGAFVMTTARGLMRSAKSWDDYSKPGQPPKTHLKLLRKLLLFSYDPSNRSVVVGPTRLNQEDTSVPALLEFGGTAHRTSRFTKKSYVAEYEPRPYMAPALAKNQEKFPDLFKNSITA